MGTRLTTVEMTTKKLTLTTMYVESDARAGRPNYMFQVPTNPIVIYI